MKTKQKNPWWSHLWSSFHWTTKKKTIIKQSTHERKKQFIVQELVYHHHTYNLITRMFYSISVTSYCNSIDRFFHSLSLSFHYRFDFVSIICVFIMTQKKWKKITNRGDMPEDNGDGDAQYSWMDARIYSIC